MSTYYFISIVSVSSQPVHFWKCIIITTYIHIAKDSRRHPPLSSSHAGFGKNILPIKLNPLITAQGLQNVTPSPDPYKYVKYQHNRPNESGSK